MSDFFAMERQATGTTSRNQARFEPHPLRLAICGAGAAGLCLAYKILEAQKNGVLGPVEFVLFEKESNYTGTWHANRYPGCRCDIPSAAYQFSFAPYADWPDFYSYAGEIKKYFKTFAQKYGIVRFIRLRHKVTAAVYDDAHGSWAVTVENLDTSQTRTETYDVFAPATGVLNNAYRPAIAGMESFTKTPILHTAEWPTDLDWGSAFKDERVAVIGVGSSGLQIIGTIAPYCKSRHLR
ncbi:putative dimethylaniline monooxygenase [Armillaria novae-zelandiae]|uniref:Dimethylaniline monooxygenase n=1 Tax=Armillaria novae-zelandiae TaxID=153914 RepID=A0AA39U101_9AGAR|nr:putative dimethylaniline monooxygenase [Armillaria novae-zelandiae]